MQPLLWKHASCAKTWKARPGCSAKAWHLQYSRRDAISTDQSSVPVSSHQEVDPYDREALIAAGNGSTRRRRRQGPDTTPAPASDHNSNGAHSNGSNGASLQPASNQYGSSEATSPDLASSTDRSQLVNWSGGRSRSRSRSGRNSQRRDASASAQPRTITATPPPPTKPLTQPQTEEPPRGRLLRRRRQEAQQQAPTPAPVPAPVHAPATAADTALGLGSGSARSKSRARSRSRSRSPSPAEDMDAIKSWLSKDSSPSPVGRAAAAPSSSSPTAAPQPVGSASNGVPRATSTSRARSTRSPARRSRSRSRSPSPATNGLPDPEMEKMKTWLKNHEEDGPLEVKPFELVARGHSPARVSSPERPASSSYATNSNSTHSSKPAEENGVIDLSKLPASQKHHIREIDVEDLPQTHADYGRALKEVTEVTSVMGWAKAQNHEDEHKGNDVPVMVASRAQAAAPASTSSEGGVFGDAGTQSTVFNALTAVSAGASALALLCPELLLQLCFEGAPTALEATLARVIGSGLIVSAVCNWSLKDACSHNRLGSATYQRLMGAGVWQSVTAVAVLAFHAALCTPLLTLLVAPLAIAGAVANCSILSASTGSPLPPPITLTSPSNSNALGYTLLSASLLLSAAACLVPLGLVHGSISLHLPILHHLCAPGLLAAAVVACVLQDAANRARLGATTFKNLNLGMAAGLGAIALSLAVGLKQLTVVPTLLTLPVLTFTGAGALFCLAMFATSTKQKKA